MLSLLICSSEKPEYPEAKIKSTTAFPQERSQANTYFSFLSSSTSCGSRRRSYPRGHQLSGRGGRRLGVDPNQVRVTSSVKPYDW